MTASGRTFTDRINPLVIKELRQGVRSRMLWTAFALLLLACLAICLTAFLGSLSGAVEVNGTAYFGAFFTCACFIYLFVIPSMAYQSLLREQEGETWPLLTMTGLGARRVIRGKVASALVIAGLYSSVVLPFLLFAYYLNGIELTSILLSVGAALVGMVFLTFSSVCWATFGRNRVLRGLLRTMLIIGTLWTSGVVASLWFAWIKEGHPWDREALLVGAAGLWAMLSFAYVFYETAVARLSLESEDCSRGPRRAVIVQLLGTAAIWVWAWREAAHDGGLAVGVAVALSLYLAVAGIYLATDRDGVPRGLRPRRRTWDLLVPGAVRGFRLVLLLAWAQTAVAALLLSLTPESMSRDRRLVVVLAAACYLAGYLSASLIAGHHLHLGAMTPHLRSRLAFATLVFLGALFPTLVDVLTPRIAPWPGLLSPVAGLAHFFDGDYKSGTLHALGAIGLLAAGLTLWADRTLAARARPAPATSGSAP